MLGLIKRLLQNLLVVCLTILIAFAALEIGFRLYYKQPLALTWTMGTNDLKSPYSFTPNLTYPLKSSKPGEFEVEVNINSFGFRGKDFSKEKKEGTIRIFMAGDSFTFGVGAEDHETIPARFEAKLREKGVPVEVINAGIGSTSPISQYPRLNKYYLQYKPDIVFFLLDFSDLQDDWISEKQAVYKESGEIDHFDSTMEYGKRNWWTVLAMNSTFCKYIHRKVVRQWREIKVIGFFKYLKMGIEGKRAKALISNIKPESGKEMYDTIQYDHYLLMRGRDWMPLIEKHWKRTGGQLLKFRDTLKERNIPFVLVLYPYGIHVGPTQWNEGRVYWGFEENKVYDDTYAFDFIEDFARKNEIPVINSLDAFLANNSEELYFPLDGHMNPRGNEILAEHLANHPLVTTLLYS